MKKAFKIISAVAMVVCVIVALCLAPKVEAQGRIVGISHGTNLTAVASLDATNVTAVIGSYSAGSGFRISVNVYNSGPGQLGLRLGSKYTTNDVADITIPAGTGEQLFLGEGYNGPISARSVNTNVTAAFIWSEWGN